MAPNTSFLSRAFSKTPGSVNQDPNGRHSRMASASSALGYTGVTPPSSPPSVKSNGNGTKAPNKPMPKLVLTTDSFDSDSIHAPGSERGGSSRPSPKSILNEEKDPATMSPEEVRSSEEEQMRRINPIPPLEMNILAPSPQDVTTPRPPKAKASAASLKDLTTPQQPAFEPSMRSRANTTNQLLVPGLSDEGNISDTASIISVGGTKKKRRLFRRGSNASFRSSKPDPSKSAFGAALAASAMNLANSAYVNSVSLHPLLNFPKVVL